LILHYFFLCFLGFFLCFLGFFLCFLSFFLCCPGFFPYFFDFFLYFVDFFLGFLGFSLYFFLYFRYFSPCYDGFFLYSHNLIRFYDWLFYFIDFYVKIFHVPMELLHLIPHLEEHQFLKFKTRYHSCQSNHLIHLVPLNSIDSDQISWLCIYWTYLVHSLQLPCKKPIIHFAHLLLNDQIMKSSLASSPCICCPNTSKGFQLFATFLSSELNWLLE